ncbi:hypothetical protein [Paracoccus salsus]|uniref:hypothetical protein n=1 Tax=Paracoccus salsus TaxID=2911061 RepID=UPI001F4857AB|nr:hypothetical protein [Paracoccus salsus]MCF3974099.1 hypothetical protein [Paracoccus salsus]
MSVSLSARAAIAGLRLDPGFGMPKYAFARRAAGHLVITRGVGVITKCGFRDFSSGGLVYADDSQYKSRQKMRQSPAREASRKPATGRA